MILIYGMIAAFVVLVVMTCTIAQIHHVQDNIVRANRRAEYYRDQAHTYSRLFYATRKLVKNRGPWYE